jgi:hypothetical protein
MRKVLVLAACFVFLMAGAAQAAFVLNYNTSLDKQSVTAVFPDTAPSTKGTVAGFYNMTFNGSTYWGYCVGYDDVNWDTPYTDYRWLSLPTVQNPPTELQWKQVAWLYDNTPHSAATQLAIWEILFDSGNYNIEGGTYFKVTNPTTGFVDTAQTYINQVKDLDLANFDLSSFKLLASPLTGNTYGVPHQDFITKVSEPGVLTLLGFGLVALGITRRRTK